jgi:epoxyqueuosine reductase
LPASTDSAQALRAAIEREARAQGFDALGVSGIELAEDEQHLLRWLERGWHGQMHYMQRHGVRRSRPAQLQPGTLRVISVRMNYRPPDSASPAAVLADDQLAYVSRYALGRDYHRLMRRALARLADAITQLAGPHDHRVFVDSAPVLEKALARNAGLGWIGKHTNLLAREAGSWFFLGEIYTDLHPGLSHRRHRRALSAGCTPLHLLSDDRAAGRNSRGAASRHGQSHLWL